MPIGHFPGVYAIRNTVDGMVYVGASNDVQARLASHRSDLRKGTHHNRFLQAAWDQLGEDVFAFEALEQVNDLAALPDREVAWIALLQSADPRFGYNIYSLSCGTPGRSRPLSAEHRAKLIAACVARWADPAYKAKIRAAISVAKRGQQQGPHSPERRAKIRAANRARAHLQVGVPLSAEARAKMSATRKGKKHSAETRAKMAEARRRYYQNKRLNQSH